MDYGGPDLLPIRYQVFNDATYWFIPLLKFGACTINHMGAGCRRQIEMRLLIASHRSRNFAPNPAHCSPLEIWWHMAILHLIDWWIGVGRCSLIMFFNDGAALSVGHWFLKGLNISPWADPPPIRTWVCLCLHLQWLSIEKSKLQLWILQCIIDLPEKISIVHLLLYLENRFNDSL